MGPLAATIFTVIIGLITSESVGQMDKISKAVLRQALKRVMPAHRDHYMREWLGHFEECPGPLSKMAHALGCWRTARRLKLADVTWPEYFAYHLCGGIGHLAVVHASFSTRRAYFVRMTAGLLQCVGFPKERIMSASEAALALEQFAEIERNAGLCLLLWSRAGRRTRAASELSDAARKLAMAFGFTVACALIKKCREQSASLACFRKALRIKVRHKVTPCSNLIIRNAKLGEELVEAMIKISAVTNQLLQEKSPLDVS